MLMLCSCLVLSRSVLPAFLGSKMGIPTGPSSCSMMA